LAAIAESNEAKLNEHLSAYPGTIGHTSVDEAIEAAYDGYTLATPAESHFDIALKIIRKGMNIMIEKPMTLTSEESEILVAEAKKSGSRLMVGHILLFHPAIRKIKEVIASGKIGKLFYIYSTRLNLGTVRTEESVFSSFAPHDISVLDYLVGAKATKIEAKGSNFLQDKVYDTTMTQFDYPDGVSAHIFVSWLHPFKEQLLVVVGSKGMISFDDSTKEKEIHFYNKRIDFENGIPVKVEEPDEIIEYEKKMPLEEELRYFVEHLDSTIEINTGENGLEVVRVLEAVENMIKNS
jgi:UDP-2-acetamido-3-amino-2,3-dideoxy-glucuronate N-acetyltransferase